MTSPPAPSPPAGPDSVTLHSSWRGLLASGAGSSAVFVAGVIGVLLGGWRVLPTGLLVLGAVFLATVLFDYPVASTFDGRGVTRRMMLRHHHLGWDRIDQLTRSRPGFTSNLRGVRHGGLTAAVGRRRYLLVDQPESPEEYDAVCAAAGDRWTDLGLFGGMRPPDGTNPTWLYRSGKWAPDQRDGR